jgi:hypothetical protein
LVTEVPSGRSVRELPVETLIGRRAQLPGALARRQIEVIHG